MFVPVTSNLGTGTNIYISNSNGLTDFLRYTGTGEISNRVINLLGNGGIEQAGAGVVKFSADVAATGANTKTLYLLGSTAGTGELGGAIVDNSATNLTQVKK